MSKLTLAVLGLVAALAVAAPASAGAAARSGHVTFPLDATPTVSGIVPSAPSVGAVLPNGGAILAGTAHGHGVLLAGVRANGSPNLGFGTRGLARVALPAVRVMQVLRRPDGRLLVVYEGPQLPALLTVAALTATGRLDPSFGTRGIADTALTAGWPDGGAPAALLADGSLLLTGNGPDGHWRVAKLTVGGALDVTYGSGGVAAMGDGVTTAISLSAFADGAVAVVGQAGPGPGSNDGVNVGVLTVLTGSGQPDPAFGGGAPVALAGEVHAVLARADGTIDTLSQLDKMSALALERFTRDGRRDPRFAPARIGAGAGLTLLGRPDGSELAVSRDFDALSPIGGITDAVSVVGTDGRVLARRSLPQHFGGGLASLPMVDAIRPLPLDQSSYAAGTPLVRSDGSLLVPGGVAVVQHAGGDAGRDHEEEALAAYTTGLEPDRSFGVPERAARIAVGVPRQTAATAGRRHAIALRLTASGPGLARVDITAGGRVVSQSTVAVFRSGAQSVEALLARTVAAHLRGEHGVRIAVRVRFRDLLSHRATARGSGTAR